LVVTKSRTFSQWQLSGSKLSETLVLLTFSRTLTTNSITNYYYYYY